MADVAGLYYRFGVKLPPLSGGWASTRCFAGRHQDRHPSARVHLSSGGFRCFTCGVKGGVLDALELLGVRDRDEARELAIDYGVLEPPKRRKPSEPPIRGVVSPSKPLPEVAPTTELPDSEPESAETPEGASRGMLGCPLPDSGGIRARMDEQSLTGPVDWDNPVAGNPLVLDRAWVYVDAGGLTVGRVHRLDFADGQKRIWQERPDGDGWATGLNGAHLPLFRLPELLERAGRGELILIVEGEKAVDALERLGFFATTNAGGAGKWRDEHTLALVGATVLVICDCDLPGRQHAFTVSSSLLTAGVKVLAPLDPAALRSDGFDIVDHLAGVAETSRAVRPELDDAALRASLSYHLQSLLGRQPEASADSLQRWWEYTQWLANPGGRAYTACPCCGEERLHRVSHGLAFCPCGAHQLAPA